jgi:hypothetical protein
MMWEKWKQIVRKDWHYLIIIVLLLGLILYLVNQQANVHTYCIEMMDQLGCFNIQYHNILGGI